MTTVQKAKRYKREANLINVWNLQKKAGEAALTAERNAGEHERSGRMAAVRRAREYEWETGMMPWRNAGEREAGLSELAMAIAHEIKNPVALAMANVALIKLTDEHHVMESYCGRIEQSLMNINALAQLFLPTEVPARVEIALVPLLETIAEEYRGAWPEMKISFTHPPYLPVIAGEVELIRMIFTNLIKNAAEASGTRGRIEITADADDAAVMVTIRDNGQGIDGSTATQLAKGRYSGKANGSGLGLMICRYNVLRHGGTFTLRNGANGGCEAIVTLPC